MLQGADVKKFLLLSLLALCLAVACDNTKERDALMASATTLEQNGKHAEARRDAQKAIELDPKHGQAYLLAARCYMKENETGEATKNYTRALELLPDNLEATENLGRLNLLAGNIDEAVTFADKALTLSPSSLDAKIVKAGALIRKQDYDKGTALLQEVLAANPDNEEAAIGLATMALNQQKPEEAEEILKKFLQDRKTPSVAILSVLTNLALDRNDMAAAEGYIRQLMEINKDDEQLVLQIAAIYQATNRENQVHGLFTDYLAKNPGAFGVRSRLAEILSSSSKYDEALAVVDAAPDDSPRIRLLRAGVLTQSGKVEESIPLLRDITADSGSDKVTVSAAYMGLASIFVQQNKPEDAEKELTALLERDPDNLQALFMRSGMYFNKRDLSKSLADMERVVELAPNDPSAVLGLADVLNASGNSERAEQIISDVIARFPEYPQAYLTMANLQMIRAMPEAALMTLSIGKNAVNNDMDLVMARTDILVSLKRHDEARKELEEFAKATPGMQIAAKLRIAEVETARERFTAAAQIYLSILDDNPDVQAAVEGYLQTMISAKKPRDAMAFAEKRSKARPDDPMAAYLLGEMALLNRDGNASEKAFKKALELNTAWEQPLTRLAQMYTASNRLPEAIKLCEELLVKDPKSVSPAVLLGILLEQKGDLDGAEQQYRNVLQMHEDNLLASNNLAYLLSRHKNSKERLQEAEGLAAKATASGAPATFDTLGWIQHQLGKHADAESNIRKAYAELKDNPTIAYHMATVLAEFKDDAAKKTEALELLEEITKPKAPGFAQMHDARQLLRKLQPEDAAKAQTNKPDDKKDKPKDKPADKPKDKPADKPKPKAKPEAKPEPKLGPRPVPKPEPRPVPKPDAQ